MSNRAAHRGIDADTVGDRGNIARNCTDLCGEYVECAYLFQMRPMLLTCRQPSP